MSSRLAHWLRAPLSPLARATVAVLAATFLIVAIIESQWGHVAEFFSVAIVSVLIMKFVWLPINAHKDGPVNK